MRKVLRIAALVVGLLLVFPSGLAAQDAITITPAQLTLQGVQGQSQTRNVVIQSATPLSDLTLIPMELASAEAGVLLPTVAAGASSPTDLPANTPLSVPLQFDLSGVRAGVYTGEVLINYADGSRTVPVQVSVKAQPWWPLAALIAGVGLGVGVSNYRAKGRPRDEVMVRLGQLRTQMKVDGELQTLGKPFYDRLTAELVDVEAALEAQQWDAGQTAADEAAAVWNRWRRGRPDWIVQLTAYAGFVDRLDGADDESRFIAELAQAAEDILRSTPDLEGPQTLRAQMLPLTDLVNTYLALDARIQTLAKIGPRGKAQAAALRQQLEQQSPLADNAAQALETLGTDIEAALAKLRKADLAKLLDQYRDLLGEGADEATAPALYLARIDALPGAGTTADSVYLELRADLMEAVSAAQEAADDSLGSDHTPFSGIGSALGGLAEMIRPQLMTALPEVRVQALADGSLGAKRRLRWFTWTTYGVAVVLLALAGFVELYSLRPDFGSQGVGDYFTLLAWGFGAEATRSAVADMIQSWGVVRQ